MKYILFTIATSLVLNGWVIADETTLRIGHAQTPKEAQAELLEFKTSYSDLAGWEKRKAKYSSARLMENNPLVYNR
jgi:hypothetical protein